MMIIDLDARKAQRRRVLDTGLIRFGNMSISCAICNVSNGGLALDVGSQDDIPDKFNLFVVAEKKTYSCNVVWREGAVASGSCSADRQFIFAAATGLCCGCSSIFNAASMALRRFKAAVGLHRSRPVVINLSSTRPSGAVCRIRPANSIWIAPLNIPCVGEISK